jgi:hypothetical protein
MVFKKTDMQNHQKEQSRQNAASTSVLRVMICLHFSANVSIDSQQE